VNAVFAGARLESANPAAALQPVAAAVDAVLAATRPVALFPAQVSPALADALFSLHLDKRDRAAAFDALEGARTSFELTDASLTTRTVAEVRNSANSGNNGSGQTV